MFNKGFSTQEVDFMEIKTSAVTFHGFSFHELDESFQQEIDTIISDNDFTDLTTENVSTKEVPIGAKDGSNRRFEIRHDPISRSEHVYLNGQLLAAGPGNDYVMEGNIIIMNYQPTADDALVCTYFIDFQDQYLIDTGFYATDFAMDYDETYYDDFFDEESEFFDDFKDDFFDDFDFDGDGVDDFEDHDSRFDPFDPNFDPFKFEQDFNEDDNGDFDPLDDPNYNPFNDPNFDPENQ